MADCDMRQEIPIELKRAIVHGQDDRREYFEIADAETRARMAQSLVAIVPRSSVRLVDGTVNFDVPTWGEVDGLCSGEPFADQPAGAFCSGVLVDWDLILTAGHCVRLFAPEDMVAVRGYYYESPGQLGASASDVRDVEGVVVEALDPPNAELRLDFAWLRLGRPVELPWQPAPVYTRPPPLKVGDSIVSIGTGGGVPMKADAGGRVRDVRENTLDFFLADTDTSHGSSGGAAFDESLAVLGVLARGGTDLFSTDDGCNASIRQPDGAPTEEQFTYVHRAIEGLCAEASAASSICREECGDPCTTLPPSSPAGCAYADSRTVPARGVFCAVVIMLAGTARRRGNRRLVAQRHDSGEEAQPRRRRTQTLVRRSLN
jgi:hypothetical protein